MPKHPAGAGETARAARRASNILQHDRVILAPKHQKQDVLVQVFNVWLAENLNFFLNEFDWVTDA